jgi:hypothetical protein
MTVVSLSPINHPPDDLEQKVSLGLMSPSQRSNAIATSIFLI